jgi:hypothetical protein
MMSINHTQKSKDYVMCMRCFSSKHTSLRRKSRYWLDRNQVNVSDLVDLSIRRLVFNWASTTKIETLSNFALIHKLI